MNGVYTTLSRTRDLTFLLRAERLETMSVIGHWALGVWALGIWALGISALGIWALCPLAPYLWLRTSRSLVLRSLVLGSSCAAGLGILHKKSIGDVVEINEVAIIWLG
jgi:hypothetical protein